MGYLEASATLPIQKTSSNLTSKVCVVPCGGAATYRNYRAGAETLDLLTMPQRWLFWMQKDIRRFVGREQELPFDLRFPILVFFENDLVLTLFAVSNPVVDVLCCFDLTSQRPVVVDD